MKISLKRIILYVQDVKRLKEFYQENLGLSLIEEITGEWAVLQAGVGELALHRVGKPYRVKDTESWRVQSNGKLVFEVDRDIEEFKRELLEKGVPMREVKSYPGFPYILCEGKTRKAMYFNYLKRYLILNLCIRFTLGIRGSLFSKLMNRERGNSKEKRGRSLSPLVAGVNFVV